MAQPSFSQIISALQSSWAADTAFIAKEWSPDNPARGQCVVSSLVIQDYLGGDLGRYKVTADNLDEMHYYNVLPDGTILDTTGQQYNFPVTLQVLPVNFVGFASVREKRLSESETRQRYELLKSRVSTALHTSNP